MIRSQVKIAQIVFDFDSTLFDTESLKDIFWHLGQLHGYGKRNAQSFYQEARTLGDKMVIAMESYLTVLKKHLAEDGREFKAEEVLNAIMEAEKVQRLLPGARELLEFCKQKNIPRYLLSLGVAEWQEHKVRHAGVDLYIDPKNIIYTDTINTGKVEVLKELFGKEFTGQGTVLFNDKPDETAYLLRIFPELVAFVRREKRDERFVKDDFERLQAQYPEQVSWSENLSELQTALEKIL